MALFTLLPDNIAITVEQLGRLPVLKDLYDLTEYTTVTVPDGMLCSVIAEYAACEAVEDFVLYGNTSSVVEAQKRTLDWCGVDITKMYTVRELKCQLRVLQEGVSKTYQLLERVDHLGMCRSDRSMMEHFNRANPEYFDSERDRPFDLDEFIADATEMLKSMKFYCLTSRSLFTDDGSRDTLNPHGIAVLNALISSLPLRFSRKTQ